MRRLLPAVLAALALVAHGFAPPALLRGSACRAGSALRAKAKAAAKKKKNDGMTAKQRAVYDETVEEFETFQEALECFVEMNGHSRVTPRSTLPDKESVPEALRKYKLGLRFSSLMRGRQMLRQEQPQAVRVMEKLGVDFDDEMDEWDRLLLALTTYKEVTGETKVSARYVCPAEAPWPAPVWGYRLGARLNHVRNTGMHIKNDEARVRQLDELGFDWRRAELDESKVEPFETVLDALQIYRRILGDLSVPSAFVVPSVAPWPEHLQGLPLGQRVVGIRSRDLYVGDHPERIDALNDMGFIWSTREQNVEQRFQMAVEALQIYKNLHNGDAMVPQNFKVPQDPAWPEHLWGMQLGNRVNSIRSHGTFIRNRPDRKAQLTALGFPWDPPKRGPAKGRVLSAETRGEATAAGDENILAVAEALPDMQMLDQLGVDEDYEEGDAEAEIRDLADPLRDGQPAAGYVWKYRDLDLGDWAQVVAGFQLLGEVLGEPLSTANVPRDFVPGGPNLWRPELLRDVTREEIPAVFRSRLDEAVRTARFLEDEADRTALALEMGEDAEGALGAFAEEGDAGGDAVGDLSLGGGLDLSMDVGADGEPSEADLSSMEADFELDMLEEEALRQNSLYAEKAAQAALAREEAQRQRAAREAQDALELDPRLEAFEGVPLGDWLWEVCRGEVLVRDSPERLAVLTDAGVDLVWDDDAYLGVPFNLLVAALGVYRQVRGSCLVPLDFVVPESPPWPFPVRRLRLGLLVNQVRLRRSAMHFYHPEKMRILKNLEWHWLAGIDQGSELEFCATVEDFFVPPMLRDGEETLEVNPVLKISGEQRAAAQEDRRRAKEARERETAGRF